MQVVSTHLELGGRYTGSDAVLMYQMVQSSQVMQVRFIIIVYIVIQDSISTQIICQYEEEDVPEARFSYDLSPMSVVVSKKGKHWYEFVTSICALIGGTFTVVGLLSAFLGVIFKAKKI